MVAERPEAGARERPAAGPSTPGHAARTRAAGVLGTVCFLACLSSLYLSCSQKAHVLTLLHFNDFHGQVQPLAPAEGPPEGGLARLAALAMKTTLEERNKGGTALILCAGDIFTGTAFSTLFQGEPEFRAMDLMGLAAMTPGNHEWDFGAGTLTSRARSVRFPLLMANVRALDPSHTFWRPSVTVLAGAYRVGVIGVTTEETPMVTAPGCTEGFRFSDPVEAVGRVLNSRGPKAWDYIVVLSHCGFEVDREIARRFPTIGVIVGGHDHKVLKSPFFEGGVAIVQAGDRGRFLGSVRIRLKGDERTLLEGRLLPVDRGVPEDLGVKNLLSGYLDREDKALSGSIGTLPAALSGDRATLRSREAPLGDLLADAMRSSAGADVALLNAGAIRAGLPSGEVTGRHLYAALPFFDSLCTVRLRGEQVQALLDRCASMPLVDPPGGFLQVSGLSVRYSGGKALEIRVGEEPLVPEREYLIACTLFLLSGGDGHVEFSEGRDPRDWGVSLQELARKALASPALEIPEEGDRIRRGPVALGRPGAPSRGERK